MSREIVTMRIIAGKYRHRKILWPSDKSIRPTKDRIREAVFSMLGDLSNKVFLDLYSGSGAIAIEAISRGAGKTYFVDNSQTAIKCIKENISLLGINEEYEVHLMNDESFLSLSELENLKFDVIYLDPPYKEGQYEEIIMRIVNSNLLNEDAIIVAESERDLSIDESLFKEVRIYKYGEIKIYKLRK